MEIRGWSKQKSTVLFPLLCTSLSDSFTPSMQGACSGLKIVHRYRPAWDHGESPSGQELGPCSSRGGPSRLCISPRWVVIMAKHWKESETILVYLGPFPYLCALGASFLLYTWLLIMVNLNMPLGRSQYFLPMRSVVFQTLSFKETNRHKRRVQGCFYWTQSAKIYLTLFPHHGCTRAVSCSHTWGMGHGWTRKAMDALQFQQQNKQKWLDE